MDKSFYYPQAPHFLGQNKMNNTPDYNNNLAFAPGDWSDSRVTNNTDRTASTIQLVEKIEELEKENAQLRKWCEEFNALTVAEENSKLKQLLAKAQGCVWLEKETYNNSSPIWNELNILFESINEVLK